MWYVLTAVCIAVWNKDSSWLLFFPDEVVTMCSAKYAENSFLCGRNEFSAATAQDDISIYRLLRAAAAKAETLHVEVLRALAQCTVDERPTIESLSAEIAISNQSCRWSIEPADRDNTRSPI
jgi:hypothetical protein